jgi:hypothetical protein
MPLSSDAVPVVRAALQGMKSKPASLPRALTFYSHEHGIDCGVDDVLDHLAIVDPNDLVRLEMTTTLQHWDFLSAPDWASGTAPNTRERRERTYELLQLDGRGQALCDDVIPVWIATDTPIVIAEDHLPWYAPDNPGFQFYWPAYCRQLLSQGWLPTSIEEMGQVTSSVIERISNPSRAEQYQSKGLVVGYVQSGKTANFTGVIARAADAGYRLFIILAGTMDILRQQTQRRIDKELIGGELLENDYVADEDWPDGFLSHGALPSQLGAFDWQRLTGPKEDFQQLRFGIDALDFPKHDPSRPLYDPVNLSKSRARIVIVKKNPAILRRVAKDLFRVRARLADIPTLVIDDESDLASINTRRPTHKEARERTATNRAIVDLLKQLPRSQYIGYTATPFANVFIDPSDAEDLFPKDFIVSLPRPEGYMGISDFHDIDTDPPGYHSNERAFVRDVTGDDEEAANLPRALDTFLIAGALKLYRSTPATANLYRHHTMLVHVSPLVADQEAMAQLIERLLDEASYHTGKAFLRLRSVWEQDFVPVCSARADGLRVPGSFDELRPHIGECLRRLEEGHRVLVVNGDPRSESPDFDRQPIWKIICGGAKLSRGYTVEGLTISYYRRRTNAADTLMQMGRWFGFRKGYKDLVRLFIGRAEPVGRTGTIDLYEAFEAVCRDELEFRSQLRRYSVTSGDEKVTPKQVPPLVPAHLLRPTSTNKMYNARIAFMNLGGQYKEPTLAPTERIDAQHNEKRMRALLNGADIQLVDLSVERGSEFRALCAVLQPTAVLDFLRNYRWMNGLKPIQHEVEFLAGQHGDPEIDDWLLVAPQIDTRYEPWEVANIAFSSPRRARTPTGRFGVYSEPRHRPIAAYVARIKEDDANANANVRHLRRARRGVLLFYPVNCPDDDFHSMGFAIQFPENSISRQILFTVIDPSQPDAVTVDA